MATNAPNTKKKVENADIDPENPTHNIAIIGAGWAGIQLAACLRKKGARVQVFEQNDDLGGTWHPKLVYHGLKLHSPTWLNEFDEFPYPDRARMMEKLSALEMQQYIRSFVKVNQLESLISYNCKVTSVIYNSNQITGSIIVENQVTNTTHHIHGFDLIVLATFSSTPNIPEFEGKELFKGELIHNSEVKADVVQRYKDEGKRVVVLGASKSASDMMIVLSNSGVKDLTWLYRKSYHFICYERLNHSGSPIGIVRGMCTALGFVLAKFSPTLCCFYLWMIGIITTPLDLHFDLTKFHAGTMDKTQLATLRRCNRIKGEPKCLTEHGVRLENGKEIPADVVICGTGYGTGLPNIKILVDGKSIRADHPKTNLASLYHHIILPEVPVFAIAASAFYTLGMKRGVTLADHLWWHLNQQPMPYKKMKKIADSHSLRQDINQSLIYNGNSAFAPMWMTFYVDLVKARLVSPSALLWHVIGIFAFNRHNCVRLKKPDTLRPRAGEIWQSPPALSDTTVTNVKDRSGSGALVDHNLGNVVWV